MGDYLRDARISFLTISEKNLEEIDGDLKDILISANQNISTDPSSLSYVLRYDGMGIIRINFSDIKSSFNRAKKVERVVFQLTSPNNYLNKGKNIQINLDAQDSNNCFLLVTDDDEAWVDSIFGRLKSRLEGYHNGSWFVHSTIIELLIQLLGVFFGFSLCFICANILAPIVNIKYSFFVLFVGFFLIFSNLWTYMLLLIGKVRNRYWPYISFKKKPLGVIGQAVICFCITLFLSGLLNICWNILKSIGTTMATK